MPRQVITIAGAGIAGLSAAINLALHNREVRMYESRPDVGLRHHLDFQGIEHWSPPHKIYPFLHRINIAPTFFKAHLREADIFDFQRRRYRIRFISHPLVLVQRGSTPGCLDYALKQQALNLGVDIRFNNPLSPDRADILATGPRRPFALACGVTFTTQHPNISSVILDNRLAPAGYAYLTIINGTGFIITVLFRHFRNAKRCIQSTTNAFRHLYNLDMDTPRHFSGVGNIPLAIPSRQIRIGEAGGLQDALFGFGMKPAMLSGYLAARALIEGKDYWQLVRRELLPFVRQMLFNRMVLEHIGNRGNRFLAFCASRTRDASDFFRILYTPRWIGRMAFPLCRLYFRRRI
jgi:hypothetical protein